MGSPGATGVVEYGEGEEESGERIVVTKHTRHMDIDFGEPVEREHGEDEPDRQIKHIAEKLADWEEGQAAESPHRQPSVKSEGGCMFAPKSDRFLLLGDLVSRLAVLSLNN